MNIISMIVGITLLCSINVQGFPSTNDIVKYEFISGGGTNSIPIDMTEGQKFIAMFPLFGNMKPWADGIKLNPGERIDPAPLIFHLLLTMKSGKQRCASFSLHGGLIAYRDSLRQVPKDLRKPIAEQLERWNSKWESAPNFVLEERTRMRRMLNDPQH